MKAPTKEHLRRPQLVRLTQLATHSCTATIQPTPAPSLHRLASPLLSLLARGSRVASVMGTGCVCRQRAARVRGPRPI